MSYAAAFIAAIHEAVTNMKADYSARCERIYARYCEENNNIPPTIDPMGRAHAPCDGYYDPIADLVRGGGEYLTVWSADTLSEYNIGSNGASFRGEWKDRFMIDTTDCDLFASEFREAGVLVSFGKAFVVNGVEQCYAYVVAHKSLIKRLQTLTKELVEAQRNEAKAGRGEAPEGKQTVTGKIIKLAVKDSPFGVSSVMLVQLPNQSTVYGTQPGSLDDAKVGDVVEFSATFTRASGDNTHSFFKRPTKAQIKEVHHA